MSVIRPICRCAKIFRDDNEPRGAPFNLFVEVMRVRAEQKRKALWRMFLCLILSDLRIGKIRAATLQFLIRVQSVMIKIYRGKTKRPNPVMFVVAWIGGRMAYHLRNRTNRVKIRIDPRSRWWPLRLRRAESAGANYTEFPVLSSVFPSVHRWLYHRVKATASVRPPQVGWVIASMDRACACGKLPTHACGYGVATGVSALSREFVRRAVRFSRPDRDNFKKGGAFNVNARCLSALAWFRPANNGQITG